MTFQPRLPTYLRRDARNAICALSPNADLMLPAALVHRRRGGCC
jgi:hypothetical protein